MNLNNTLTLKNKDIKEEKQRRNAKQKTNIRVSHEVPTSLLEKSLEFNDYDYCLPHLLDENEEYRDFFYKSKEKGRYIIMDNSLHELGKPYNSERLWYWMNELKPDEFIVPDYWQDKTATLVSAKNWVQRNYPKNTTPMAVVQGTNKSEAIECYRILKMQGYKKIAFSYGADWYYEEGLPTTYEIKTKHVVKAHGRYNVIKDFYKRGIIEKFDKIHLLGCNIPQEFAWYKDMPFIESLDTSNPIIHGLKGIRYFDFGLLHKESDKIDKLLNLNENWKDVEYNIKKFRSFIN